MDSLGVRKSDLLNQPGNSRARKIRDTHSYGWENQMLSGKNSSYG